MGYRGVQIAEREDMRKLDLPCLNDRSLVRRLTPIHVVEADISQPRIC